MAAVVPSVVPALDQRPVKGTLVLMDVDGTITKPRLQVTPQMLQLLSALRQQVAIGFVGGSDLVKQEEQLAITGASVITLFDYCFSENGLTAYRMGVPLAATSFIQWLGEEKYKKIVKFILHYIADLDIPVKRGTFIEFRNGMINVSPIGRNASQQERMDYEQYDLKHNIRKDFVAALQKEFADYGLRYSIGGQISFDVFPEGWDKTYCLRHVEAEKTNGLDFHTIHFFGDKTFKGGNDYEIFEDPRTIGHSVTSPEDTARVLKELFPALAASSL